MAFTWELSSLASFFSFSQKQERYKTLFLRILAPQFRVLSPTKTMAELLLSAFLEPLLDQLASQALQKFARPKGLKKQLAKWEKTLKTIQTVLDDAEEKQLTEKGVKVWLDDLRDLAYDLEDILDEFATKALQSKLKSESQASTSTVQYLIPTCCSIPSAVKFKFRLESKIEKINNRFNDLVTQKDQLNLNTNVCGRPNKKREILPTTSLVKEDCIYGREDVAGAVLQLLVSEKHIDASNKVPKVIPIYGMGGIGKTTLAQLVYNHKEVDNFFDLKAWACVSEDFDIATVTKTILQSVTSDQNCDGKDLNWLQVELKKKLDGKRFLVILDDIWNEDYDDWTHLCASFKGGAPGSSIVITTRIESVSSRMGTVKIPFQLELLSNDACLSIFSNHALDAKDFSGHSNLKDIGEEIVKKCEGLPLAVKTVGGLLRGTQAREEWEKVLKSKIWNVSKEKSKIGPALMLSYIHLPSYLKRCFAYCSILPKDYEFKEKEVVLLWMAEGLIQPRQVEDVMADLGTEYFRSLLSRSLFQQSPNKEGRFLMHDLVNDLAQSVAGDTCFRMEDRGVGGSLPENIPSKARHISYLGSGFEVTKRFEVFSKCTSLRTFLPLMLPIGLGCYLAHHVPFELIQALRCLRVLSFNGHNITKLSDSIRNLKHLRYLDLSDTKITSLPESITTLCNLQTLLLKDCARLKKLPSMLQNLLNLRHLNLEGKNCLKGMPMEVGKLTCLQTLSNFILGEDNCSGINELGALKNLKGTLCISGLENVMKPEDAKDAELIRKTKISALRLEWSADIDESEDSTRELEILDGLRPHDDLEEFVIIHYGGTEFPIWLTSHLFTRMVSLTIENCEKCTQLPPFGQLPSLKFLLINNLASVKNIGPEFCGDHGTSQCFRSLESLSFKNMKEWESWSPCKEFPNLHKLSLDKCPKLLGKLPNRLPLLKEVKIHDCEQLVAVSVSSFPDQCKINIDYSEGVVCGSNVMFKSIISIGTNSRLSGRIEGFDADKWLSKLEYLTISRFETVDEVEEGIFQLCKSSTLKTIEIIDCKGLESLPKALMYNSTCLAKILFYNCHSLTHIARGELPPTLKHLDIYNCRSLTHLARGQLPPTLKQLVIDMCPSLESLTSSSGELPTTLQYLSIFKCEKITLPDDIHKLTSLRNLEILNCPSISSFPTEGFPTKLTSLSISHLKITEALFDWGLDNLTVLKELCIGGCQHLVSFPEMTLPASLISLRISVFSNLECLSSQGLRKLTSLQTLVIYDCNKFASFSDDGLPPSLLELDIFDCQKLRSFPKNGLPPSLQRLAIRRCPLLEERFKKDQRGGEWRRMADIPCVEINGKYIYDTEEKCKAQMKTKHLLKCLNGC